MRKITIVLATGIAAIALSGCGKTLTASNTVGPWPFTVDKVSLECGKSAAIFLKADGKAYPLNGEAERQPQLHHGDLSEINDITKIDPQMSKLLPGTHMSLEGVLRAAVKSCPPAKT